jgi:hypothetical protein
VQRSGIFRHLLLYVAHITFTYVQEEIADILVAFLKTQKIEAGAGAKTVPAVLRGV